MMHPPVKCSSIFPTSSSRAYECLALMQSQDLRSERWPSGTVTRSVGQFAAMLKDLGILILSCIVIKFKCSCTCKDFP
jgi:hypothetical protein